MTALVSFERVFEVPRPAVADRGEKPDAVALPPTASRLGSTTSPSGYPRCGRDRRWPRWSRSPAPRAATAARSGRHHLHRRARVRWSPRSVPRAPARRRSPTRRAAVRRGGRCRARRRDRRPGRDPAVPGGRGRLRHPGRACSTTRSGQPAVRPPGRLTRRWQALEAHRSRRWCGPCPTGSTPWSAIAATASRAVAPTARDRPAAAEGPAIVVPDEATAHLDNRQSEAGSTVARRGPTGRTSAGDRAPSRRSARPTRSSSSTAAGSCSAAPTSKLLSPRAVHYADLYRTPSEAARPIPPTPVGRGPERTPV